MGGATHRRYLAPGDPHWALHQSLKSYQYVTHLFRMVAVLYYDIH